MFAASLRLGTPRINNFSGDATPGKTEVSFKQWYQEVKYVKDHYPEAVVWDSIIQSLKGPAVDMARYMGPTTSIAHILQKLSVIFGTVTSFNILMKNFYKVTQGNTEKVPSFVTWLEGTLNQIQLQCLRRMRDLEAQKNLKDHLFHGVHRHICNSVQYLHSTPATSYLQLMVAARKVESKNEETWEGVRAKAAVTTDLGEGMAKLHEQFAKLMATLTQTGQDSGHPSDQLVPGCMATDGDVVGGASLVT